MKDAVERFKMQHFSSCYDHIFSSLIPTQRAKDSRFLFINGSGRNGSTLLSCILNNHPSICIPPEHNIIPLTIRNWYLHPFKSWKEKVNDAVSIIDMPSQWNADTDEVKNELLSAPSEKNNVIFLLQTIYSFFAKQQGKTDPVLGDKTPANTIYLKTIKKQFAGSKVVFLVRDPRDVMASYLAADNDHYAERFDFMLWRWKNALHKYESLCKKDPGDVMLLKYEDLVSDPQQAADKIALLLGLPPLPGITDHCSENLELLGVANAKHHQNLRNEISTASIGKWKHSLTKALVKRTESKLGDTMLRYGYEI